MKRKLLIAFACGVLTLPLFSCSNTREENKKLIEYMPNLKDLSLEDITAVRLEKGNYGTSPQTLCEIKYAINNEDITRFFNQLEEKIIKSDEVINPGSSYYQYTYFTKTKSYTFKILDDDLVEVGNDIYKVSNVVSDINIPSLTCYSLSSSTNSNYDLKVGEEVIYTGENLDRFEFVVYQNDNVQEKEPLYRLESKMISFDVYTERIFKLNETYYELTKEYKFFE